MKQLFIGLMFSVPFLTLAQHGTDTTQLKKPVCPVGKHTSHIIPIVYGRPTQATAQRAERGEIRLGGCVISEKSPHFYCTRDKKEF